MSSPLIFSLLKTSFWGKKPLLTAIGKKDRNKIQMIKNTKRYSTSSHDYRMAQSGCSIRVC